MIFFMINNKIIMIMIRKCFLLIDIWLENCFSYLLFIIYVNIILIRIVFSVV